MQVYPVWQATNDIMKPTKFWRGLLKADQTALKPYVLTKLMGEGDSSQNMCQLAHKKKTLKTSTSHLVECWISLFDSVFNNKGSMYTKPEAPKLRNIAMSLCKTNPKDIFDKYVWQGSTLNSRQDMLTWTAARKFLGDIWSEGKAEFELAIQAIDNMEVDKDKVEAATAMIGFAFASTSGVIVREKKQQIIRICCCKVQIML
jgi:hypothetical protein